jgi:hypothetical protein
MNSAIHTFFMILSGSLIKCHESMMKGAELEAGTDEQAGYSEGIRIMLMKTTPKKDMP